MRHFKKKRVEALSATPPGHEQILHRSRVDNTSVRNRFAYLEKCISQVAAQAAAQKNEKKIDGVSITILLVSFNSAHF